MGGCRTKRKKKGTITQIFVQHICKCLLSHSTEHVTAGVRICQTVLRQAKLTKIFCGFPRSQGKFFVGTQNPNCNARFSCSPHNIIYTVSCCCPTNKHFNLNYQLLPLYHLLEAVHFPSHYLRLYQKPYPAYCLPLPEGRAGTVFEGSEQ